MATTEYDDVTEKIKIEGETIVLADNMFSQTPDSGSNFLKALKIATPDISYHTVTSSDKLTIKDFIHSGFKDAADKTLFPVNPYKTLKIKIFRKSSQGNTNADLLVGNTNEKRLIESQVEFVTNLDQLSESEKENLIKSILLAANEIPELDVAPNVLVSGMGTEAFKWKITFGNMGRVAGYDGDGEKSSIENNYLRPLKTETLGKHKVSGVAGTATNIKFIIGSEKNDWIYTYSKDVKEIGEFTVDQHSFGEDSFLEISQHLNLQTGQAVLYKATDATKPINGLVSGAIYFVEVVPTDDANKTRLKFLSSHQEVSKIGNTFKKPERIKLKWTDPIGGSQHKFFEVVGADGGAGNDRLITSGTSEANLLFGGKGNDLLVGSVGADYLYGGENDDKIFLDGSHDANANNPDFQDTISGGPGEDRIYGYSQQDFLSGSGGDDLLAGGKESDLLEGGSGNDRLVNIGENDSAGHDRYFGGNGDDWYIFKGEWGVASLAEQNSLLKPTSGNDLIDMAGMADNYVHILSDGALYSTAGLLIHDNGDSYILDSKTANKNYLNVNLGGLSDYGGSPGTIHTELGFGFHQYATGVATVPNIDGSIPEASKAVLKAPYAPSKTFKKITYRLWLDQGSGGKTYNVTIPLKDTDQNITEVASLFNAALPKDANNDPIVTAKVYKPPFGSKKIQLTAMSNNSVGGDGKVIPAKMELTVQGSNVIGVNGNSNFEHFDALELGDGANTFVFGNNYWGGGSSIGNNLIQTIPLADMLMRNVQSNFEVNTSLPQKEGIPLFWISERSTGSFISHLVQFLVKNLVKTRL